MADSSYSKLLSIARCSCYVPACEGEKCEMFIMKVQLSDFEIIHMPCPTLLWSFVLQRGPSLLFYQHVRMDSDHNMSPVRCSQTWYNFLTAAGNKHWQQCANNLPIYEGFKIFKTGCAHISWSMECYSTFDIEISLNMWKMLNVNKSMFVWTTMKTVLKHQVPSNAVDRQKYISNI